MISFVVVKNFISSFVSLFLTIVNSQHRLTLTLMFSCCFKTFVIFSPTHWRSVTDAASHRFSSAGGGGPSLFAQATNKDIRIKNQKIADKSVNTINSYIIINETLIAKLIKN